jgi:hypothetical protein
VSALPRPHLAPGAHRELVDALHDLHHRAGWPSLRRMAAQVGASHTTVSKIFSHSSLPAWGTLELLVEALGGEVSTFHELWLRASSAGGASPLPSGRIAGRRSELATVRGHLEHGSGLMLVAGEAGMGKTRLVVTAARTADVPVAVGHCLPLSTQTPLMPVAEVLRDIHDWDGGKRLGEALAKAPSYVRDSISRLLPELAGGTPTQAPDDFSRQRLSAAVSTGLSQIHSLGEIGLLVEDLHWADTATLDLLERLVTGDVEVPVVGTWRLDDPDTDDLHRDWWVRMRRLSAVTTVDLAPLTREESADQCRLLGIQLDEASVDAIHQRSGGQPLFTEQLAAQAGTDADLPVVLADLLDRRLERLDDSAQVITRALGVADRGLEPPTLAAVTGLEEPMFVRGLRELTQAHLLAQPHASEGVELRHPLLAEAVRRRLVASEATGLHRRLAEVLSREADTSAAEVAEHWRGARDHENELEWRISAARAAGERWAASQAAEQWLRALEVWPESRRCAGDPLLTRPEAYLAAMDALKESLQFERAAEMSAEASARFPELDPPLRAEFLRRSAVFRTEVEGPDVGLQLIDESLGILSTLPVGEGMVRAMARKHQVLLRLGRFAEAGGVARACVEAAETAGDRMSQRLMLGHVAWHEAVIDGDLVRGTATMAHARSLSSASEDPTGDIWLAVIWTDVLLILGAGSTEVLAAGRDALARAEELGIPDFGPVLVRYNVVRSLIDDGRVTEALDVLGPAVREKVDLDRAPLFMVRSLLDVLSGRLDDAATTIDILCSRMARPIDDLDLTTAIATVELWSNRPGEAWSRVQRALEGRVDSTPVSLLLPPLVLGARAVADLAARGDTAVGAERSQLTELHRRATGGSAATCFTARALAATWSAELARLDSADTVRLWQVADAEWSSRGRPHDAAYCRWRAAQAAIRDGRATAAAPLLKRAAADARGHEPLLAEIEATGSRRPGA